MATCASPTKLLSKTAIGMCRYLVQVCDKQLVPYRVVKVHYKANIAFKSMHLHSLNWQKIMEVVLYVV